MSDGEVVIKRAHVDFGNFEEDVVTEILARLPVKSLMRFRCVCKPWCALISDSYFVKKHFSYQERSITDTPRRLIFSLEPPLALDSEAFKTTEDYQALQSVNYDDVHGQFALIPLDFPSKALILWNPCTRDFTVLPNLPNPWDSNRDNYNYLYGLGFDSANDDYKVMWGVDSWNDETGLPEVMIHIFSLKTGSWKTAKDIDYVGLARDQGQGLFLNGALHWISDLPDESESSILSFDLGAEEFCLSIPMPYVAWFSDPLIHSNCLCVCTAADETKSISIWMMKQYGVKESWTELVQVSLDSIEVSPFNVDFWRPLCTLENGVVLTRPGIGEHLVVFSNLKDKTFKHCVEEQDKYFEIVIY